MYIKTEKNKIINLNHYRSVEVYGTDDGYYVIRAILAIDSKRQRDRDETIATFDKKEEALIALDDLFGSKLAWDANAYKTRQQLQSSL